MSQQYTTMSLEALKLLCATINKTVDLPNTVISDTSIATNTTYSSHKLDKEFTTLEDALKHYTDTAIAGLNKLTKEIINDKFLVTKDNVLYLYKAADDPSNDYMQMMLINGVAVELGSTQVDMTDYYNKTDSDNRFAAKLDLDTLTTSFNDLKTVIGDTSLLKNATLMEDVQELYTGLDGKVDKTDITTTISSTSTDSEVPSAKAVYGSIDNIQTSLTSLVPVTDLDNFKGKSFMIGRGTGYNNECVNVPNGVNGAFVVEYLPYDNGVLYGCQRITLVQAINGKYVIFERSLDNGNWSGWQKVCTTSVADVPVTKIASFSDETNYKPHDHTRYYVSGGTCFVNIDVDVISSNTDAKPVITGLPKPVANDYVSIPALGTVGKIPLTVLYSFGNINLFNGDVGCRYLGSFSYKVAEE